MTEYLFVLGLLILYCTYKQYCKKSGEYLITTNGRKQPTSHNDWVGLVVPINNEYHPFI